MSTAVLVQALAALSVPACAASAALAGTALRLRRGQRRAAARTAELGRRVLDLESARAALERTAATDPLTGVGNYRHLQLTLDREIDRHLRSGRPMALVLLEVGGFGAISEAHGHPRAHAALRDLAQRLAVEVRRTDTLGRYGGEEFLVLLPDTGREGAAQVAERLCWTVRRHRLPLPGGPGGGAPGAAPVRTADGSPGRPGDLSADGLSADGPVGRSRLGGSGLTAVAGVAVLPGDGDHAATLLRAADRSLAGARRAPGGRRRPLPPTPAPSRGGLATTDGHTLITKSDHAHLGVSAPQ
ncbi:GGDEF domain-containing protein [Streptomyces sp. NPDC001380]|uniref:GGDEF domain-containing protein n=1 Tax=Streptomyces sp. NPDC001380 TaxID=3364566 RepID=UPI0036AB3092